MAVMGPELPGSPERTLDQSLRGNLSTDPVWQSFIFVYVFSFFFLIKKKETCIFTGYVILGDGWERTPTIIVTPTFAVLITLHHNMISTSSITLIYILHLNIPIIMLAAYGDSVNLF